MTRFILGVLTTASATIAIFFLKFCREGKDRLFAFFAAAFGVLSVDWLARAFLEPRHESQHYLFLIRLVAFLLIIAGIVDKNRSRPGS
jgi:zinc transporter ZupT